MRGRIDEARTQKSGKISCPFGCRRQRLQIVHQANSVAILFPSKEKECLVASVVEMGNSNRSAKRATEIVLPVARRAARDPVQTIHPWRGICRLVLEQFE